MTTLPKEDRYQCPCKDLQGMRCSYTASWPEVRTHATNTHKLQISGSEYENMPYIEKSQGTQLKSDETPEQQHSSGAKSSSGATKFRYLSQPALNALSRHLHNGTDGTGGAARYGRGNWEKGIEDVDFLVDRLEHLQDHAQHLHLILVELFDTSQPVTIDLKNSPQYVLDMHKAIRGIGCNWMFIQHALEVKLKR